MTTYQQFQEGISSDEIEEKLKFVKQTTQVAKELGKAETISSLLPFLHDWCPDNDDEALTELAKEIYNLRELFTPDEMKNVLPILKHLATAEEVVVREAAVESINKIVEDMSPEVVRDEMVVVIEELFHDEWFTPRVSSVSLIARAYSKIASLPASDAESPLKTLRDDFFALCKDDTPMVRRAAAKNMPSIYAVCADSFSGAFVAQFAEFFAADDDTPKLTLMSFTKELLQRVTDESDRTKVLDIFRGNLGARSYKLREASALEVGAIAAILQTAKFCELLLEPYLALFKDNYMEVRKNAIKQISALAACLEQSVFLEKIFTFLAPLAAETNPVITEQVASVVVDLCKLFPEKVNPLFELLLKSPAPQVRLLILRRLDEVALNESLVSSVVLTENLDGPDWRVREEVAKHMAYLLASTQGTPQLEKLIDIYLQLFVDKVSKVRETCRGSLATIITKLGADFAFDNVIKHLQKQYVETENYLWKFNILYTFEVVVKAVPTDARVAPLIETIMDEMDDNVPNLRFISCRILSNLGDLLPEDVKQKVVEKMKQQMEDTDRDVRYYAALGLKAFKAM